MRVATSGSERGGDLGKSKLCNFLPPNYNLIKPRFFNVFFLHKKPSRILSEQNCPGAKLSYNKKSWDLGNSKLCNFLLPNHNLIMP